MEKHSIIEKLVEVYKVQGISIDVKNDNGLTPLACAIQIRDVKSVRILFEAGAVVGQHIGGRTELYIAVECRNYDMLSVLIKAYKLVGISVDIKNYDGLTPLRCAVQIGDVKSVTILLEAGAAVGQQIGWMTELHAIINNGRADYRDPYTTSYHSSYTSAHSSVDMLKILCKAYNNQGVSIDIQNSVGLTPLVNAIQTDNLESVAILLEMGAALGQKIEGEVDLHFAVKRKNCAMVETLAQAYKSRSVSVDVRDQNGATPLICASKKKQKAKVAGTKPIKILLDSGANPNAEDNDGNTALYFACVKGNIKATMALIRGGANINQRDQEGCTPFMWAMETWKEDIEKYLYLINIGADVNIPDNDGVTALIYTVRNEWYTAARSLLQKGANPEIIDNDGNGALYYALRMPKSIGQNDFIKTLAFREAAIGNDVHLREILASGFKSDSVNGLGQTLLYVACYNRHTKVVGLLLEYHADPNLGWPRENVTPAMVIMGAYGDVSKNLAREYSCPGIFLSDYSSQEKGVGARISILKSLITSGADITSVNSIAQQNLLGKVFKKVVESFIEEKTLPQEIGNKILQQSVKIKELDEGKLAPLISGILYEAGLVEHPMPRSGLFTIFSSDDLSLDTQYDDDVWEFYLNYPEYNANNIENFILGNVGPLLVQRLIKGQVRDGVSLKNQLVQLIEILKSRFKKTNPTYSTEEIRKILEAYKPKKDAATTDYSSLGSSSIVEPEKDTTKAQQASALSNNVDVLKSDVQAASITLDAPKETTKSSTSSSAIAAPLLSLSGHDFRLSTTHPALTLSDVSGDGNCFFYAVAEQLAKISDSGESSMNIFELRRFAVNYVNAHRTDFKDFMPDESPEQYIARIERNKQWADHVLIKALALELQINIVILEPAALENLKAPIIVTRDDAIFARTIFLYHIPELHYKSIDSIDIARLQYTLDILRVRGIEVPEFLVYHPVLAGASLDSTGLVSASSSSSSFSSSSSSSSSRTSVKSIVCYVTDIQYDNPILDYNHKHEGKLFSEAKEIGGTQLAMLLMEVGRNKMLADQVISAIEVEGTEKFLQALTDSLKKQQEQQDFEKALNIASNVQTDEESNVGFYTIIKQFAEDISSSWSISSWAPNLLKAIEEWLNWDRDETDANVAKTCQLLNIAALLNSGVEMPLPYGGHGPNDPDDGPGGYGGGDSDEHSLPTQPSGELAGNQHNETNHTKGEYL